MSIKGDAIYCFLRYTVVWNLTIIILFTFACHNCIILFTVRTWYCCWDAVGSFRRNPKTQTRHSDAHVLGLVIFHYTVSSALWNINMTQHCTFICPLSFTIQLFSAIRNMQPAKLLQAINLPELGFKYPMIYLSALRIEMRLRFQPSESDLYWFMKCLEILGPIMGLPWASGQGLWGWLLNSWKLMSQTGSKKKKGYG